jgi:hypothetical protein
MLKAQTNQGVMEMSNTSVRTVPSGLKPRDILTNGGIVVGHPFRNKDGLVQVTVRYEGNPLPYKFGRFDQITVERPS